MPTEDPSFRYVWLVWASAFLVPWIALFVAPSLQRPMLWASVLTAPFGLMQFLFVPKYWNPPTLFDLAHRTGLDIESLIFCFTIGGLGVAGYRAPAPAPEHSIEGLIRHSARHRWHLAALISPFFVLAAALLLPWNHIYAGIAALKLGRFGERPLQTRPLAKHFGGRVTVTCLVRRDGVVRVDANFLSGTATILYDETRVAPDGINRFIADCGYHCRGEVMPA